jgi:hypothetical protein
MTACPLNEPCLPRRRSHRTLHDGFVRLANPIQQLRLFHSPMTCHRRQPVVEPRVRATVAKRRKREKGTEK